MTLKHHFNAFSTMVLSEHIGEAALSWNGKESQKENILSWKGFIRIMELNPWPCTDIPTKTKL